MRPPFPSCDAPARRYARLLRCARRSAALVGLLAAAGLLLLRGISLPLSLPRGEGPDLTVVSVPSPSVTARTFTPPALEAPPEPESSLPPPAIALLPALPELTLDTDLEGEPWSPLPDVELESEKEAPSPRRLAQQRPAPAPPAQAETVLTPPAYLSAPEPPYPAALRQRRIEGNVRVRISVSAEGRPTEVVISESSGYVEFDRAVLAWIPAHWRFHPATRGGAPVSSTVTTRICFRQK